MRNLIDESGDSILKNIELTTENLREFMNQTHANNRLIAVHPSADTEMLEEIIDFWGENDDAKDPETCRLVIRHPNVGLDVLIKYGGEYPVDLLANPCLEELLATHDNLFESIPEILSVATCPVNLMDTAASTGGLVQKAWLKMNPELPIKLRNLLSSTALNESYSLELDRFIKSVKDIDLIDYLKMYKDTSRPFCIPNFVDFDRNNKNHRIQDQVLAGFPFTSSRWPWPSGKNGRYMQPIVQIDLKNAGIQLAEDLGTGLLQIWGGIDSNEIVQRIISLPQLDETLDSFYPDDAPWLSKDMFGEAEMDDCMTSPFSFEKYRPYKFSRCRVEWIPFGNMYYPSLTKRVLYPFFGDQELSDFNSKLERRLEKFDEKMNGLNIPTGLNPGKRSLCTLGGYIDGLGNTSERHSGSLLFYHSIDDGVKVTIGITFKRKSDGAIEFTTGYTCDN